jgi:hypothetical protein
MKRIFLIALFFKAIFGIGINLIHQYDLITIYNNVSQKNQTVMSVMFLYIEDKEFKKPKFSSGFF